MDDSKKLKEEDQVDLNYEVFKKRLPELMKTHKGKYLLMKDKEELGFFDSMEEAYKKGLDIDKNENFSIQEVTDEKLDLGWFSCEFSVR